MKIYFAGSIAGGRDDAPIYEQIVKILQLYGQVLTEHIGKIELTDRGEILEPKFIFDRDVAWLTESDLLVAEVTNPSLGVGYELGISEKLGKKVLCLFRPSAGRRLSPMVSGNSHYEIIEYQEPSELEEIFRKYLQ